MCERRLALIGLFSLLLTTAALAADEKLGVTTLDLPFKVTAMRGPGSEVALAVSTSGIVPVAKPKPASADPKAPAAKPEDIEAAPVAVVWGQDGGALLGLVGGSVRTTLLGADAVEGLAAAETPRVAVPGSRRAVSGPITAYFTGPLRATGQAAGLTIRERQPLGVTAEPKAVPIATATVAPGPDLVFAARKPTIAVIDGKPAVVAVTMDAQGSSSVALVRKRDDAWAITARTKPQIGGGPGAAPLAIAGIADFDGSGRPQLAIVRAPDGEGVLQVWSIAEAEPALRWEAPGYAGAPAGDQADLAAVLPQDQGAAWLALPVADRTEIVVVSLSDGVTERMRAALPAKAATGVAVLGKGAQARILVGLEDGRVAVVPPPGPRP